MCSPVDLFRGLLLRRVLLVCRNHVPLPRSQGLVGQDVNDVSPELLLPIDVLPSGKMSFRFVTHLCPGPNESRRVCSCLFLKVPRPRDAAVPTIWRLSGPLRRMA